MGRCILSYNFNRKKGSHVASFAKSHRNTAQDGGSHKVPIFVSLDVGVPPVQQQLGSLIHPALDQRLHPDFGFGRDQGTHIGSRLITFTTQKKGSIMLKYFAF